eukprot:Skav207725  [mRNA]  locus=scaffold362:107369:111606:- [translate_table: standard]
MMGLAFDFRIMSSDAGAWAKEWRWTAPELLLAGAIDAAETRAMVLPRALQLAQHLRVKGRGAAKAALPGIKRSLYREVLRLGEGPRMVSDARGTALGTAMLRLVSLLLLLCGVDGDGGCAGDAVCEAPSGGTAVKEL